MLKEILHYRELLFALTLRDIRVKYKQAAFGIMWVFFMPVLAICGGVIFRFAMAHFRGQPLQMDDVVAVMVKTVPWLLFAGMVNAGSNSLLVNIGLITKIYFRREVVPLAAMASTMFDFVISLTGLVITLTLIVWLSPSGEEVLVLGWNLLWAPLLLGLLIVMAIGAAITLSAANLFFRDVKYIVQVCLQYGVFFSLVYFTYEELPSWGQVLLVNPVAPLLEAMRMALIEGTIPTSFLPWLGYSAVVAVGLFIFSLRWFERAEGLFAEYA